MSIIKKSVERLKTVNITIVKCDFCGTEVEHDINKTYVPECWGSIEVMTEGVREDLSICSDCLKLHIKK